MVAVPNDRANRHRADSAQAPSVNTIVEMITNPGEMQPPYAFPTRVQDGRADARLRAQKQKSLREILIEGFWCKIAIFVPPPRGPINLALCAFRDAYDHGLISRDDGQAWQAPLQRIPFPRDQPQQSKGATPPLARV